MKENTTILLGISIMIFMIVHLQESETLAKNKRNMLTRVCEIIILEICLEAISNLFLSDRPNFPEIIILKKIIKIVEYSIAPIVPIYLTIIVGGHRVNKIEKIILHVVAISNIFMQIVTGILVEEKIFQGGFVFIMVDVFCFVGLILELTRFACLNQNSNILTLILIATFLIEGAGINNINSKIIKQNWFVLVINFVLVYIYYVDIYALQDPLTYLLNKRAYTNALKHVDYTTAFIMIDANQFKKVNDTYGHQAGDHALQTMAKAIFEVYKKIGYCYRVGGDEFCIILKQGMLDKLVQKSPNWDINKVLTGYSEKLDKKIVELSKNTEILKNGLSQGYCVYTGQRDRTDGQYKYMSVNECIDMADQEMYNKKSYKR